MWFFDPHMSIGHIFHWEGESLLLDRLDLEMETDEREDQALQILDQVVETPTKKSMKNNIFPFQCFPFQCNFSWHKNSVADPGCLSRISDPDYSPSRIQDQKTATKKIVFLLFFIATNITKL